MYFLLPCFLPGISFFFASNALVSGLFVVLVYYFLSGIFHLLPVTYVLFLFPYSGFRFRFILFYFTFNRQPNQSTSVDVHYADSVRAKAALDTMMDGLAHGTPGLWVRSVPVKEKESINRKAVNDYKGEVRRYSIPFKILA